MFVGLSAKPVYLATTLSVWDVDHPVVIALIERFTSALDHLACVYRLLHLCHFRVEVQVGILDAGYVDLGEVVAGGVGQLCLLGGLVVV